MSKVSLLWGDFQHDQRMFQGAACATSGQDPEIWTGDFMDTELKRRAKRICRDCKVLAACATYAINHPHLQGIWGGLDDYERSKLRRAAIKAQ